MFHSLAAPLRPDLMRLLDRALGVPLCFLLSAARRGLGLMRRRAVAAPRRVLFIGLAEMGSVVLAEPALLRVRDTYRCPPLFLIFAHNRDSLQLTGTVAPEHVFPLRANSLANLLIDALRFSRWARRHGVDTVIDIEPAARFSTLLALCSGARIRAGFERLGSEGPYRGKLYTHPVRYDPALHIAHNLLAIVDAAFVGDPRRGTAAASETLLQVRARPPGSAERARVARELARIGAESCSARMVLINPNVGDMLPQRRWPAAHYSQLVQALLGRDPELFVALIGAAEDAANMLPLLVAIAHPRCISLAGRISVAELPALFERSALLISSDSGPAHFAAVSSMPVIALFGPETPLRYRPLGRAITLSAGLACSPCVSPANQRRSACRDNRCMQDITVRQVLLEACRLLDQVTPTPRAVAALAA